MYIVGSSKKKPKSKCSKSKSIDCKDNRSGNVGREPSYRADGKLKSSGGLGGVPSGAMV